jgi:hypothetical protein
MRILAIDPGTTQSGWLLCDCDGGVCLPVKHGIADNDWLTGHFERCYPRAVVMEWFQSYGMPVGKEVFETCWWVGRFHEAALEATDRVEYLTRGKVKLHLCGSARAKDANVRQALIDLYGGKDVAVGRKLNPGPLYGIKSHIWSAMALARTWNDTRGAKS